MIWRIWVERDGREFWVADSTRPTRNAVVVWILSKRHDLTKDQLIIRRVRALACQ
jgi:hypothetical protein